MVSVLRQLQAEWNSLVPAAQAAGVRRVRMLNAPLEPIAYRREKLEWLRQQLGITAGQTQTSVVAMVAATTDFVEEFTFGVEIECFANRMNTRTSIADRISQAGVPCTAAQYDHITRSHWRVVQDGSLGDYTRGMEIVSPVLRGAEGFRQLEIVMKTLKAAGCKINRRCGFHVHVGVGRDVPVEMVRTLALSYAHFEQTIESFLAPSRRGSNNMFCTSSRFGQSGMLAAQSLTDLVRAWSQIPDAGRDPSRYRKLNLKPLFGYGTVEFRQHQGTVEADRARNWVLLCLMMVRQAKAAAPLPVTTDLSTLVSYAGATAEMARYFQSRQTYFMNNANSETRRRAA